MRWLENLIGLYLGHAVILEVWQWMEVQMYGEVQAVSYTHLTLPTILRV